MVRTNEVRTSLGSTTEGQSSVKPNLPTDRVKVSLNVQQVQLSEVGLSMCGAIIHGRHTVSVRKGGDLGTFAYPVDELDEGSAGASLQQRTPTWMSL